jgi:hypothetical protein
MRSLLFFFLLLFSFCELKSQGTNEPPSGSWTERLGFGGNVGLRFGDVTYFEASPIVGYRLGPFLMPGVGGSYRFYKDRYMNQGINIWGASAWIRAYPLPMIFAYAEHEELYGSFDYYRPNVKYFIGTNFVGGGYTQGMGNASTYVMVLFAINQEQYGIYTNPIIRVGFMIGGNAE